MSGEPPRAVVPAEDLWNVHDVCRFLKLKRNTVYEMAKRGELPHLLIGARIRFVPEEIREWAYRKRPTTADVVPIGRLSP
jgi:excisionase family DNA binding protein